MTDTNIPLAPLAADMPPTCDTEGCNEPATFAYTWDWGQSGVKCSKHASLLSQVAESLQRRVSVSPLAAAAPAPLQRDERVRLTAEAMVVKEELAEAKLRGLDLYRENVALTRQLQALTVRGREVEAQLKDAQLEVAKAKASLAEQDAKQGDLVDEVTRLRVIAKFSEPASQNPSA